MSSVECLREFVSERLTAAAEEIFRVFKQTVVDYEKVIDRQRRLLDIVWKPEIELHRIELPQQQEEFLADRQLCNDKRNPSLDQEEPEPPQIKEEREELHISQEREQLELKQETDTFTVTPTCEESDHSEDQTLNLSIDETQSAVEEELLNYISVSSSVVSEPNNDHQLLSHNPHAADSSSMVTPTYDESDHSEPEPKQKTPTICDHQLLSNNHHISKSQNKKRAKHGDSRSTKNAVAKPNKRHHQSKSHINNVYNPGMSKIDCKTYTGEKSFKCDTCGKDFKLNSAWQTHMRIHKGEKPFTCKTCGKDFSRRIELSVHIRTHTGEKLCCKTCGRNFRCFSALLIHMRIHTGEKPFSCKTCGKRFTNSSALLVHVRIHTGERPFTCQTCGRGYRFSGDLTAHVRRAHTGEKPYFCKTCGKRFVNASHLAVHKKSHTDK